MANSGPTERGMSGRNLTPVSSSDSFTTRSGSESGRGGGGRVRLSVDLIAAGRRHLAFLRSLAGFPLLLLQLPTLRRSLRRYHEQWMPLIADLTAEAPPMLLPPPDVLWVWHCHCLHPGRYREYCEARFGALVDRPVIFDEENEEYAFGRCREIWAVRYPSEPFDLDIDAAADDDSGGDVAGDLFPVVARYHSLYSHFSDPFVSETVYLVTARRRYLDFLDLTKTIEDGGFRMVPTSDILLMWLTHQSYPVSYAKDTAEMGDLEKKVVGFGERAAEGEAEAARRAWEEASGEPYERAGAGIGPPAEAPAREIFNWEAADADVNRRYRSLQPRSSMEVYVFLKGHWKEREDKDLDKKFLQLRTVRFHREMKIDRSIGDSSSENWQKAWQLYCEFGTRGVIIEVRRRGSSCLTNSKVIKSIVFLWNDLLRSVTLTLTQELDMQVRVSASVTPPTQAPYLLRCVPDRVTDDNGAMISDEILRMNRYRPQEGRWLTRTVLDHARRECFVMRIRVGRGIWRRGAETPMAIKWEDRIIEVRDGPWKYVGSSVGTAPEKVVGMATPKKEDVLEKKVIWYLSTGDVLTIQWEDGLIFRLENESSKVPIGLLRGRRLQYQIKDADQKDGEEDKYVTLIRFTAEHPDGKATALLNLKLFAVEFLPEEDAVLVLLLCMAIIRTISEIRREDVCGLLVRRRVREVKVGHRDWGSVTLPSSSPHLSPHLQPWYWNAEEVLASAEIYDARGLNFNHTPADGKDILYKQAIIP